MRRRRLLVTAAVVVTFDEDDNHAHNQILTAVLHKGLRATTVAPG